MKKPIIIGIISVIFLAMTYNSTSEGWKLQTLPVGDFVNDIYFLDSLTGWVVTQGHTNNNDTAYIFKTTDGGDNWITQYARNVNLSAVYFIDNQTGYVGGGSGTGTRYMLKTTNGGDNWIQIMGTFASGTSVTDMQFINRDTGWYSDQSSFDGGIYKTTNGGINWINQLDADKLILRFYMINKDSGWAVSKNSSGILYRTTNGGNNWIQQREFTNNTYDVYFFNRDIGLVTSNRVYRTTDGGNSWTASVSNLSGFELAFANDSVGWTGSYSFHISKTTDGGVTWYLQNTPVPSNLSIAVIDTSHAWVGGGSYLAHTIDGGGVLLSVNNNISEISNKYELRQNYPNPFNPSTTIQYSLIKSGNVKINVYDITGRIVKELVNQRQNTGEYKVTFDGSSLSSGIYIYTMSVDNNIIDTKKMLLVK